MKQFRSMASSEIAFLQVCLAVFSVTFLLLLAAGAAQVIFGIAIAKWVLISVSFLGFLSLLAQWIFWIAIFYQDRDTTRLLLCFVLPYFFALWASIVSIYGRHAGGVSGAR